MLAGDFSILHRSKIYSPLKKGNQFINKVQPIPETTIFIPMMIHLNLKKIIFSAIVFLLGSFTMDAQQSITLEDIFTKGTFAAKGVAGYNSMKDGKYYCIQDAGQNLIRYAFAGGQVVDTILRASELVYNGQPLRHFNFAFSADESKLLIETQMKTIYRHSYTAQIYVFDFKTKTLVQPTKDPVMLAELSPDASKLAYVKENNLYYYHLANGTETPITSNGKINHLINGTSDWVYEEEFALTKGFYWNETGSHIAYYEFDESKVHEYEMAVYGQLYPEQNKFKYPKAGESNSVVRILVYNLSDGKSQTMDIGNETDIYIPRIYWMSPSNLCIERMNRLQNKLELLQADIQKGSTRVFYSEENKAYIDVPEIHFIQGGQSFLISSEKNGWNQLYHITSGGKLIRQITQGSWDLDQFLGFNERTKTIYYTTGENKPAERQVYAISLDGKSKRLLTAKPGWNTATFNSDYTYFLHGYSTINTPPVYTLRDGNGKEIRVLEANQELQDKMRNYGLSEAAFTPFKNAYQEELNAFMIKPSNFSAGKKYPVLMYVYGGPGHQLAVNRWMGGNYFWYQMLASKGYLIFCADGRGTGGKGEDFKKATYLQLGKYEIEDQIEMARQLGKLPYVDATRIGIWGWSFGGYMASLAISKGADVFKTAIAVAPVTNWRYYDNIYTERFMRKPQENGKNYDDNSPLQHAEKIKGNYLIIHGTADDNVHFQNTVEMVNAMINKGIKFDSEFYPNKNHGIGGAKTRLHLYDRMTRYILEKL